MRDSHFFFFAILLPHSSFVLGGQVYTLSLAVSITPFCEVEIDYTAANEYFTADNGHLSISLYFGQDKRKEPVFDALQGFLDEEGNICQPKGNICQPSLTSYGFTLCKNVSQAE